MRALGALLVVAVLASCSVGDDPAEPTRSPFLVPAREFAEGADRALVGTRYEDISLDVLAHAIVDVCESEGSFDAAVNRAVAELPGEGADPIDAIVATEVVVAGVVEVCPLRVLVEL